MSSDSCQKMIFLEPLTIPLNVNKLKNQDGINSPVLHSARHQRPARERHKIRIASRENVDNQMPRNTNFTH